MLKTTVVILNWNGGEIVTDTISSTLKSDYDELHVLVVDNNSRDGSDQAIERRFPDVTLIRNSTNLGFAAGNNTGIRYALEQGAECIVLLNNDAHLEQSALRIMVNALLPDRDRGVIVPKVLFDSENALVPRIWSAGGQWLRFPPRVVMRGYTEQDLGQYDTPASVDYAPGCALAISRRTFESAGLLDASYFMYFEDYEFCDRLRRNGLSLWYEPQAIVHHLVSASTGEGSPQKWRYWSQGILRFYLQHFNEDGIAIASAGSFVVWVILREWLKGNRGFLSPLFEGLRIGWSDWRTDSF